MRMRDALRIAAVLMVIAPPAGWAQAGWFAFEPTNDTGPSVIGMEEWLDKPAGRHGVMKMEGERLVFEDGTPVKLWGVNIGGGDCCPGREQAVRMADFLAKYGVNAVRLHKPWSPLYKDGDSVTLDPAALDRFDFFCAELHKRGIYTAWSFFYHRKLKGKDLEKLKYPDELVTSGRDNQYGIADFCPDIQQILIDATVNLLNHRNPYSGLKYSEDPGLACVEFQNEACIMFWEGHSFRELPSYLKDYHARFTAFLKEKYGTQEKLIAAWGPKALNIFETKDEQLDKGNIESITDAALLNDAGLKAAKEGGCLQRMLDNGLFMHEEQNTYYGNFAKAVRAAGYKGPLVGSCWRGKGGITDYYNLRSDALVGIIDRHNYHGGLSGWKPRTGDPFGTKAQVNMPGGGLFSSGMMQVSDRPYAFSEWATVFPNEWVLESPAIIAVYGMGLQGWDASYQFAIQRPGFRNTLHANNLWQIARPENAGLYPALARMIYRGDVQEGEVISVRRISLQDLENGVLPWGDEYYSGWKDIKVYQGPMPGEALAAGRVVVEFTDEPAPSEMPEMEKFMTNGVVRSGTGQLVWDVSDPQKGFFTVNAPGTRALVGFVPQETVTLGSVSLNLKGNLFAGVFVTSLDREKPVEEADRLLLTVMARAKNSGMEFNEERNALTALGGAPILLEPVKGTLSFEGRDVKQVNLLDHDGRRTDRTITPDGGRIDFDGARERTLYYEILL